jgi:hypothetical protein
MEIEVIQNKIHEIRGCKVMLDFDLALLYNVENKRLKSPPKPSPKGREKEVKEIFTIRQFAINYTELQNRITEIEGQLPEIYNVLNYLVEKENKEVIVERNKIGYKK